MKQYEITLKGVWIWNNNKRFRNVVTDKTSFLR